MPPYYVVKLTEEGLEFGLSNRISTNCNGYLVLNLHKICK
jgi:hypothetical protein